MKRTNKLRLLATLSLLAYVSQAFAQKENMETIADIHHLAAYLVAGLMIAVFVMIFSNRVFYYRQKAVNLKAQQQNTQLSLVLDYNKTQIWTYDTAGEFFTQLSNHGEERTDYSPIDFSMFYHHDDFSKLLKTITSVVSGKTQSGITTIRSRKTEDSNTDEPQRLFTVNISILQNDAQGKPAVLLGIQRDITDEKLKKEHAANLALQYHTVFNSSLVDMIYYDANGTMTDINEKACESFEVADREQLLASKPNIKDLPSMQDLDLQHIELQHSSSITDLSDIEKPIGGLTEEHWGNKKSYYEQILSPIHNEQGELEGIVMAGRNITEMVESQHHQKWASRQLAKKTRDIQAYIDNINYSLHVSNVRMINYNPDTHVLEISSDLNNPLYKLPQIRCVTLLQKYEHRRAKGLFQRMDRRHPGTFKSTFETIFHDSEGRNIYLSFSVIPVAGKNGITHYFGMCQDNTEMVYTEKRLMVETQKAQETESLKNTFLKNMSHEIRTPLNAILGFAELFNNPHADEDEPIFSEEIKRNTSELLQLVNDILYISRLDAKMEEFNKKECDFATLFDGYCYMGWSTVSPNVVVSTENPYNSLKITIDEQHLGSAIQKLCTLAALHTEEGTIRAKYVYHHGELSISIEDTGKGISKEQLPHIYDRFARNKDISEFTTGLDLPIVKEMIEQMGGSIEIQSEEDRGNTAYIIIPCEMNSMEKKTEIII